MRCAMSDSVAPIAAARGAGSCNPSAATGLIAQGMPAARLASTLSEMPAPKRSGATID